jgi:flagellar biosynthesis/type III secretory pathway protein FliH
LLADAVVRNARFPSFPAVDEPDPPVPPPPPTALEEAERAREAARREGFTRGREEGRDAALAEWIPRLTALAAALERTIAVARAERERLAAEVADVVPQVAVTIARKVIAQELADGEAKLGAVLEPVVRRLAQERVAAVRVAPDVAEALRAWLEAVDEPPALAGVTLLADETLERGDWIVETESGFLDGRLATQLEEAGRLLTEPDA